MNDDEDWQAQIIDRREKIQYRLSEAIHRAQLLISAPPAIAAACENTKTSVFSRFWKRSSDAFFAVDWVTFMLAVFVIAGMTFITVSLTVGLFPQLLGQ